MRHRKPDRSDGKVPRPESPTTQNAQSSDFSLAPGGTRIGERLIDAHLASAEDVLLALKDIDNGATARLGRLLLERGVITERDLTNLLAQQHSLEVVELRTVAPKPDAASLLSPEIARSLVALPLFFDDNIIVVAVADPSRDAMSQLRDAIGQDMAVKLAAESELRRAIDNTYRAITGLGSQVRMFEARDVLRRDAERSDNAAAHDDAPVVQVVQTIILQALRDRASDIHLEPQADRVRVRYRIDGALHDVLDLPGSMGPAIASRVKVLASMNIIEKRRPQDGQITTEVEGRPVDIRVSTSAVVGGEKVVLRLLDKSRPLFTLEQLGMPKRIAEKYARLLRTPYGMVICAGPTGSGKTTTLYGSLGEINRPDRNIMTIEDPVEYTIPSINQIQINEQAGVTFAGGLKSILRQDPDIILVGEIRDAETARIAVQSALTGHFVLSSLHATDAAAALHRLVEMGIETFLVASSVTAVLSQRLVRRVCTYCRESYKPSPEEIALVRSVGGSIPTSGFARGSGCNFCAQTGYLERIGVYEFMPITDAIRELVLDRASHEEIRRVARAEDMHTLAEEAVALIQAGVTNPTEVMRSVYVVGA
jgi:type IV pilus assembly protein PilB